MTADNANTNEVDAHAYATVFAVENVLLRLLLLLLTIMLLSILIETQIHFIASADLGGGKPLALRNQKAHGDRRFCQDF